MRKIERLTPAEAGLIVAYVAIALVRQVTHDVRNLIRWAKR